MRYYLILTFCFLLNSCSAPELSYHHGLTKIWQNKGLDWNASTLTLDDGFLFGSTSDKTIFKIEFQSGNLVWKSPSSTSYSGQKPLITDNQIFIGGSDNLNSYDLNGNLIWTNQVGSKVGHSIIDYDSLIFASLTGKGLQAFSKSEGKLIWTNEPKYQMLSTSDPAIRDSVIVLGDFDYSHEKNLNHTVAINAKNGQILWKRTNKNHLTAEALFHRHKVLVSYDSSYSKGLLVALDLNSGSTIWEVPSNPVIHIKPIIFKNLVLVPSYVRGLDALDLTSGELVWSLNNDNLVPATELTKFKDKIYYGTQNRKFVSIDSLGHIGLKSDFEYGVGNPLIFKNELYVTDGNDNLFKINNMP